MIKRIDATSMINNDIVEFVPYSEPLYLFHDGELDKLTPQEYSILVSVERSKRAWELHCFRNKIFKYSEWNG